MYEYLQPPRPPNESRVKTIDKYINKVIKLILISRFDLLTLYKKLQPKRKAKLQQGQMKY